MSQTIRIELSNHESVEVPCGTPASEILARLPGGLPPRAVAVAVNGEVRDLSRPVLEDARLEAVLLEDPRGLEVLRHSAAHILAEATKQVVGEARLTNGPAIQDGFYYDMDVPRPLTPEDLRAIEKRMKKIARANHPFVRREVSRDEAARVMNERGESYKIHMIDDIPEGETVSLYEDGDFVDLCRGPHLPSTGRLGAFRLTHVAGAYWQGDESNRQLQRVYGTAWATEQDLEAHLERIAEAKKRDHRRLGVALDLFSIQGEAGSGLIFWHPKGGRLRMAIEEYMCGELRKRGYEFVYTPHVMKQDLWRTSGHLEYYADAMYGAMDVEGQPYRVKPMNCPGHILIYKSRRRSYRELPMRLAEFGTVYRFERSGTLSGLFRVRGFTQDDAHIFCTEEQLRDEIEGMLELVDTVLRAFHYEYRAVLSTRPEVHAGTVEQWTKVEAILEEALRARDLEYRIDAGEGAFYAPKIDILMRDALGREWQGPTVQVDFNLPERFDLSYVARDGASRRVYMVHRAILGSLERFFGMLIEHTGGAFPAWIAPVQARVLTVAQSAEAYARDVEARLRAAGVRVEADLGPEKIGAKIRAGLVAKIPFLLVAGAREAENGSLAVRDRKDGDLGSMSLEQFLALLEERIGARV